MACEVITDPQGGTEALLGCSCFFITYYMCPTNFLSVDSNIMNLLDGFSTLQ